MFADFYFQRYLHQSVFIKEAPHPELNMVVVIPCFDEPDLIQSLNSLLQCNKPACAVEVIVVVNASEQVSEKARLQNQRSVEDATHWAEQNNNDKFTCFVLNLTDVRKKDAGVGFARKTGMDEALARFNQLNKSEGIILSFDADALCDANYFTAIEAVFFEHTETKAASIYFEHPVSGVFFDKKIYDGIIQYELHLRYFNQALKYCGFPYAYHTIGSSFAVKASVYAGQGGMNRKQAGEDFYFLHKIIPLGNFVEINSTRIIPSPRSSHRVPFGTGAALQKWIVTNDEFIYTYNLQAFFDLALFIKKSLELYCADCETIQKTYSDIPESVRIFVDAATFEANIIECNKHSTTRNNFEKRFFSWINAFKIIRFLNTLHNDYFQKMPVHLEAEKLGMLILSEKHFENTLSLLMMYRILERGF